MISELHEKEVEKAIEELRNKGYKVIKMSRKVPDGIAVKDGKIFAVEVMGQVWSSNYGWQNNESKREKEINYSHFDGILYFKFRYPKQDKKREKQWVRKIKDMMNEDG